ncbi:MAG: nucleoside monophosphate kinase [Bryobacteraceae bacterium]|nr:nucleoside monophosphate kinase [Bryobacteraceae bacterium]
MIVLLFGPPGCGKGTQTPLIQEWLNIPAIATGEMLRQEIRSGTRLGRSVKSLIDSGHFVGDTPMNRMLLRRVKQPDCAGGFLLDGYPRTVPQAVFLDRLVEKLAMPTPFVIHLEVPAKVILDRLSGRRVCPHCGSVYNIHTNPPTREGYCACGVPLVTRPDDQMEVVRARQVVYHRQTGPVLDYYSGRNCYTLNGNRDPREVFAEIQGILEAKFVPVRPRRRA